MSDAIETIKDRCVHGKRADLLVELQRALDAGTSARDIMSQALIPAMAIVGSRFSRGEFFLPQMLIAARAMQAAMEVLKPRFAGATGETRKAKAVLGTVRGDFHDIGKNIVKLMLEGAGYEVHDLGIDVAPEKFVEAVMRESPRFVLMSALLTLTMESMKTTLDALISAGVRDGVVVGVGGAPVTQKFADEIGADFYAADAYLCVEACNQRHA